MTKFSSYMLTVFSGLFYTPAVFAANLIDTGFDTAGFNLAGVLSFFVKVFFTVAALAALLYLLLGAFEWITSGGEKEKVSKAQQKIQAAVIGVIMIVAVLAIAVTLEQLVFRTAICFGITCDIKIPELIRPSGSR